MEDQEDSVTTFRAFNAAECRYLGRRAQRPAGRLPRLPTALSEQRIRGAKLRLARSSLDSKEDGADPWEAYGEREVLQLNAEEAVISITAWSSAPDDRSGSFNVSKAWHSLPFDRQRLALAAFSDGDVAVAPELRSLLLGQHVTYVSQTTCTFPASLL